MTAHAARTGVVTLAHGRRAHLDAQHRSLARAVVRPDTYLVVAMADPGLSEATHDGLVREVVHCPGDPARLPLAAARNLGARTLRERGCTTLVFLDVDCVAAPDLVAAYAAAVADEPATVWSGPVTYLPPPDEAGYPDDLTAYDAPHAARPDPGRGHRQADLDPALFWSLSFATSAAAWERAGGFSEAYTGYGGEDTDFARRAVGAGLALSVTGDARAFHQWHPVSSPPVEHLHDVLRNATVFHEQWGEWPMLGWLRGFAELGLAEERDGRWVATGAPVSAPVGAPQKA